MAKLTKEEKAFNRGIEIAALTASFQEFHYKNAVGTVSVWQVGEEIAKMIRSKKKVAKK